MSPIYNFICKNQECEHEFEIVLPAGKDQKTAKCPICGKKAKKIPSINARMKGNWSMWAAME